MLMGSVITHEDMLAEEDELQVPETHRKMVSEEYWMAEIHLMREWSVTWRESTTFV
jgi:hypothetical protein